MLEVHEESQASAGVGGGQVGRVGQRHRRALLKKDITPIRSRTASTTALPAAPVNTRSSFLPSLHCSDAPSRRRVGYQIARGNHHRGERVANLGFAAPPLPVFRPLHSKRMFSSSRWHPSRPVRASIAV